MSQRIHAMPGGVWPVMLTPFTETGAIDWPVLDRLIDWYLAAGVAGLFAVCLSSEMYALTNDERQALAAYVVRRTAGRVPVVATGIFASGSIATHVRTIRAMAETGVNAVIVAPCLLVDAGEPDTVLQQRLQTLWEETGDIPLGLYECPQPYHRLLSPDLFAWTAASNRFCIHKDTCCAVAPIVEKRRRSQGTPLTVLNANVPTLLESLRNGVQGYCGTAANFCPELFVWLCDHYADEADAATECQQLLSIVDFLVRNKYPLSAKAFLAQQGIPIVPTCRTVSQTFSEEERLALSHLGALLHAWKDKLGIHGHMPHRCAERFAS